MAGQRILFTESKDTVAFPENMGYTEYKSNSSGLFLFYTSLKRFHKPFIEENCPEQGGAPLTGSQESRYWAD